MTVDDGGTVLVPGRSRWLRAAAAVASVALVAAACGGNGGDGVSAEGEVAAAGQEFPFEIAEPSQADIDRAERAIDLLGGFSAAFVGVLLAADGGYSADQIFAGIDSGSLQRDGTILGTSGELIAPNGLESGLIERALGEPQLIVFSARAGDLTDEEIDRLSDEELEREFDDVFGDLDIPTVEEAARSIEDAMRAEFPLDEDLPFLVLGRVLEALDDEVPKQELIFRAVTGRYSDDHMYAEAFDRCILAPGVVDGQGNIVPSVMDGCLDRRSPGLRERVEARRQAQQELATADAEDQPDAAAEEEAGGAPGGTSQLVWAADMTWASEFLTQSGPATIKITRIEGTDDFSVAVALATTSTRNFTPDGFEERVCNDLRTYTYEGTGSFDPNLPRLTFFGTETVTQTYPACGDLGIANDGEVSTTERELPAQITDVGLEGVWTYTEFSMPGVPVPAG